MPASLAEIAIEGGLSSLKCPITGIPVIVEDAGFDGKAEHSPCLRFFLDWIGELWAVDPTDLPKDQAAYMKKVLAIFAKPTKKDNQNALIAKCLRVLPKSAMVLEILDPPEVRATAV